MENKINIIKEICQYHPSCGVEKGWSTYTGGMKDSGEWFFGKMIDVSAVELQSFLNDLTEERSKHKMELTQEETVKSKTFIPDPNGGFIIALKLEELINFKKEMNRKLFYGE